MRIYYRMRQFLRMVFGKIDPFELAKIQEALSPAQMALFARMQSGEKEHAVRLYHTLIDQGEKNHDLIVAALLHDVGKILYRLNPMQRTLVVLTNAIIPQQSHKWGSLKTNQWDRLPGWRKPFIVAEHHAEWGAELAQAAGVSPLTETLIREHHHSSVQDLNDDESTLLLKLRIADNDS